MSDHDSRPGPPRVWTAITVLLLVSPAASVLSVLVLVIALGVVAGARGETDAEAIPAAMQAFADSPGGVLALLVVAQLVFLGAALSSARLSPVPLRERLGLVSGRLTPRAWPVIWLGTVLALQLGEGLALSLFDEPSAHVLALYDLWLEAPIGIMIALTVAASLLPGFCEELVCRGYVQRRLLQRWPPVLAVGLTSIVFATMHGDPQRIVGVLPIAFWLGYVAWRADSTWPTITCHAFANALSGGWMLVHREEMVPGDHILGRPWLLVSIPAFLLSVYLLERCARPKEA